MRPFQSLGGGRLYGNWKRARDEAAQSMLQKYKDRISGAERSHLNRSLSDMYARLDARNARVEAAAIALTNRVAPSG